MRRSKRLPVPASSFSPGQSRAWLVLAATAAISSCGASCKKNPSEVSPDDPANATPVVELSGVDTSSLVLSERRTFTKLVKSIMSPCGDPVTLEVCVKEARACKKCLPAAKAVATLVQKGDGEPEIKTWIENRFEDKVVKVVDIGKSPSSGPVNAPIQIVEFADFECPHCAAAMPILHKVIEDPSLKDKVRFFFKNYPLPAHEHADPAARASVAAQNQGKFWEMHDLLFTHQDQLGNPDIEGYAKKLGLDLDKFRADWVSADTKDRVAKDKELGGRIGVSGTPSIYVNGRKFASYGRHEFEPQLKEWINLDLQLISAGAAPSPSVDPNAGGSGSGAPSTSAAPSTSGSVSGGASGSASVAPSSSVPPKPSASTKPAGKAP
ncbi:MAG: thioredoxin domain-containing protein [Myxococcales bacterium]|nr:thioredoxin domain-containing protein [Myxococcales bacterium]